LNEAEAEALCVALDEDVAVVDGVADVLLLGEAVEDEDAVLVEVLLDVLLCDDVAVPD